MLKGFCVLLTGDDIAKGPVVVLFIEGQDVDIVIYESVMCE